MKIFRNGGVQGRSAHSVNSGPPHISETVRARTLRFYAHLHRVKYIFGCNFFSTRWRVSGTGPPTVFLGPLISRKLVEIES